MIFQLQSLQIANNNKTDRNDKIVMPNCSLPNSASLSEQGSVRQYYNNNKL